MFAVILKRIATAVFLALCFTTSIAVAKSDGTAIGSVKEYQSSLVSKDLISMEGTVSADLVVLEGMHLDKGWTSFRDNHIGKEMKDWESFKIKSSKPIYNDESTDRALLIFVSEYEIKTPKGTVSLKSFDTYVLKKVEQSWKIIHMHSSAKKL